MIEKIKAEHPEYKVLLTFFSPSGYEVRKNYKGADVICYLPFDTPFRVKKFLNLANPAVAVFIKYEFWGNYLRELKKRGILIRDCANYRGLGNGWYRLAVRLPEENDRLLECMKQVLNERS